MISKQNQMFTALFSLLIVSNVNSFGTHLSYPTDDGINDLLRLNATFSDYVDRLFKHRDACNIEIISWREMNTELFYSRYFEILPFIVDFEDNKIRNTELRKMCDIHNLLWNFGDSTVKLSSSNTYSYDKRLIRFGDYIRDYYDDIFYNLDPYRLSNETWYFFGDNDWSDGEWKELIHDHYELPSFAKYEDDVFIAFGLGGIGSGVPFHFHGHGFSEVIYGEKRWFLFPPELKPVFEPNMTTFYWFMTQYAELQSSSDSAIMECVIRPGQALYFPSNWYHATLNYAKTIFVTAFM